VDVVAYLDNTILEVFVLGGRTAITRSVGVPPGGAPPGMVLFSGPGGVQASNVSVWHLDGIWVPPSETLDRRRGV
jgi:hypothetical protein